MNALSRFAAGLIVRLRWPIVLAWIAAAIAVVVFLPSLQDSGDETSLLGLVPKDAESIATEIRLSELFETPVITHTHVVQRDPDGLSDDAIERAAERARVIKDKEDSELERIEFTLPLLNARDLVPSSREDRTTIVTYVFFDPSVELFDQEQLTARFAEKYVSEPDDALIGITGAAPARIAEWRAIEAGLPWVTGATIAVIALILGIHFRSPITPFVTLLAALIAYVVSLRGVAWFGEWFGVDIPRDAEPILVVLLLGVVTDYAVFFLHGMRGRLDKGETRLTAAKLATAEYLPTVVTAGLIVAGGTAALMVGELEFFRAFGPGMALTVLVSLAVAITLIPALMAILGEGLFWPRGRDTSERPPVKPGRAAYAMTARPVALTIAVASVVALGVACWGLRGDEARRHADRRPAGRLGATARPGRRRAGLRAGDPLADRAPAGGADADRRAVAQGPRGRARRRARHRDVRSARRARRGSTSRACSSPATARPPASCSCSTTSRRADRRSTRSRSCASGCPHSSKRRGSARQTQASRATRRSRTRRSRRSRRT